MRFMTIWIICDYIKKENVEESDANDNWYSKGKQKMTLR